MSQMRPSSILYHSTRQWLGFGELCSGSLQYSIAWALAPLRYRVAAKRVQEKEGATCGGSRWPWGFDGSEVLKGNWVGEAASPISTANPG
jgi:hypothetical protein